MTDQDGWARPQADPALVNQAAAHLGPTGFDPSRVRPVTLRSVIRKVPERWLTQYAHYEGKILPWSGKPHNATAAALRSIDVETCSREEVNAIIGNSSWASLTCDLCDNEREVVFRLGGEPDYEARWVDVCAPCLGNLAQLGRDSDEHRHGEDAQRLSGEAMPARAAGIAQPQSPSPHPQQQGTQP